MENTEDRVMVVSGHLVLLYKPDEDPNDWGFQHAGETKIIDKDGLGDRYIEYHNTPYIFHNEAIVRFLALRPPTKTTGQRSTKEEYFYRYDGYGRKVQHIPYSVEADCQELGWVRMALLPTINFHEAIQRHFRERGIDDDNELVHHLWRVFKGPKEGYGHGMWGISYYRADYYTPPEGADPRQPPENSPWNTVPGAMQLKNDLKEKVLPHYPAKPSEDVYVREIMERLGCMYEVAKHLFDTRREAGLP